MKSKVRKMGLLLIFILFLILVIIWRIGLIGLWQDGMSFIANNTKDFNDKNGHVIQGEYSILIDLSDLKSNIGKEIYNDGDHKIYVAMVDNTGSVNTGGYRISFRSIGQYSLSGATLISGVHHITLGEHSFTTKMSAQLMVEYKSNIYQGSTFGISGLNFKSGDEFSFYMFPSKAYESKEVSLNEEGIVNITLSNLYENIWSKNN